MDSFILAIQFLTRLPINKQVNAEGDSFAKGVIYFPIVGLIVGLIDAFVYILTSYVLDGLFPIVCTVLANICVTGAIHLDGLADTCDGIFSARKRDRMLEIMKDSRIGTHGALAIAFDLLLRVAILYSIPKQNIFWVLALAPAAAKMAIPLLSKVSVYARPEGMGGLYIGKQTWTRTIGAIIIGALIQYLVFGLAGLVAVAVMFIVIGLYRLYIYSKIQGMTGDTLGAASELGEVIFMLFFAVLLRYAAI